MQDNFNIHGWRLNQAIKEVEEATFTNKFDDNPKLKGGQKKLPDELQAQLVKKKASLNEDEDYDAIAQEEFGLDYDQLGPNEQEWVRDEAYNRMNEGESGLDFNKKVEDFIAKHIDIIKDAAKFYKQQDENYEYSLIETIYNFLEQELGADWTTQIATPDPEDEKDFTYGWTDDKDEVFYNALKSVLSKKNIKEGSEDHEVAMAKSSLQSIMSSTSKLMMMLGDEERNIPGWIQDHITNAENYIDQAAQGFHELENNNEEN